MDALPALIGPPLTVVASGTFGGSLAFAGASTAVSVGGACELTAFLPLARAS